jgi:hypothetical protein
LNLKQLSSSITADTNGDTNKPTRGVSWQNPGLNYHALVNIAGERDA